MSGRLRGKQLQACGGQIAPAQAPILGSRAPALPRVPAHVSLFRSARPHQVLSARCWKMNAEAAAEALGLAQQRHAEGDDARALRLAEKALKMDETLEAASSLLDFLAKFGDGSENSRLVQEVLNAKDHYAVFGLTRVTFDPVKDRKTYLLTSRKVHPGKRRRVTRRRMRFTQRPLAPPHSRFPLPRLFRQEPGAGRRGGIQAALRGQPGAYGHAYIIDRNNSVFDQCMLSGSLLSD